MIQIILIDDNPARSELISISLQTYLQANIIHMSSAHEAMELMDILPSIQLIITHNHKDKNKEVVAPILIDYIKQKKLDIPIIILGQAPVTQYHNLHVIQNQNDWEQAIDSAFKLLNITSLPLLTGKDTTFLPITSDQLLILPRSCVDIFLEIKNDNNNNDDAPCFIKKFKAHETYDKKIITNYMATQKDRFFVRKNDFDKHLTYLSNYLIGEIEKSVDNLTYHIDKIALTYKQAVHHASHTGFDKATIQLTESTIFAMANTLDHIQDIPLLFRTIISNNTSYLYKVAHLVSIISIGCLRNLEITKKANEYLLAFSAYFHDIAFAHQDHLSRINNDKDSAIESLDDIQKILVHEHALLSHKLIKKYPLTPPGASDIILTHHGSPSGKGFFTSNIPKLPIFSKIFTISEEYAKNILSSHPASIRSQEPLENQLLKKYQDPEIREIIHAISAT